jgi:hypothetical protein
MYMIMAPSSLFHVLIKNEGAPHPRDEQHIDDYVYEFRVEDEKSMKGDKYNEFSRKYREVALNPRLLPANAK